MSKERILHVLIPIGILLSAVILLVSIVRRGGQELPSGEQAELLGGGSAVGGYNTLDQMTTRIATSTLTTEAQIILPRNVNRKYAAVINDSDTAVYIHLANFADNSAASTTVVRNRGIRLNASGGSYEILPENMYIGDIWVASTTVAKTLLVNED